MDRKRIELLPETCKAPVLPLSLTAHYKNESPLLAKDRFYLSLPYSFSLVDFQNLVQPVGIEPTSMALQTTAMTTSAKVALYLVEAGGIEPL